MVSRTDTIVKRVRTRLTYFKQLVITRSEDDAHRKPHFVHTNSQLFNGISFLVAFVFVFLTPSLEETITLFLELLMLLVLKNHFLICSGFFYVAQLDLNLFFS